MAESGLEGVGMRLEHTAGEQTASESLSTRVCLALAEVKGVHPWQSKPLYEMLDPGILEALDEQDNGDWRLEFEAGKHVVVVTGRGEVTVDGARFSERDYREALDEIDWDAPQKSKIS
jgi:hypothetical protein